MKKLKKDIGKFVGTGMLIGAGAVATGGLDNVSGLNTSAGLGTMGGMMSPIGATLGATHVVRMVKKIKPRRKSHF